MEEIKFSAPAALCTVYQSIVFAVCLRTDDRHFCATNHMAGRLISNTKMSIHTAGRVYSIVL